MQQDARARRDAFLGQIGSRAVIMGMDGASMELVEHMVREGHAPNIGALMERGASRGVAFGTVRSALAERTHVGYDLPDLIAREEDAGHGRAGDAVGDVVEQVGVSAAVEEDAGAEGGPSASFTCHSAMSTGQTGSSDWSPNLTRKSRPNDW